MPSCMHTRTSFEHLVVACKTVPAFQSGHMHGIAFDGRYANVRKGAYVLDDINRVSIHYGD